MTDNYDYNGSYRLGLGEIDPGDFDESYGVHLFPRQDDQPGIIDWTEPLEGSDLVKKFATEVRGMDGSAGRFGGMEFNWFRGLETPLMTLYWNSQFFPNGEGSQRVTVMTFDAAQGWIIVWATLLHPDETTGERLGHGYQRIKCEFVDGIIAV